MSQQPRSHVSRHARANVEQALADTRVVAIVGARQVGKSTLARDIAAEHGDMAMTTFDDRATREFARDDPTGFIAGLRTPVVVDEVQRVPDVLLAIKQRVDNDQTPGQFLLTGSADILTSPRISDALTGRAEYIRLHPFTQAELLGTPATFLGRLFDRDFPQLSHQPFGRAAYAQAVSAGGYPAATSRTGMRRSRFFESYLQASMERDLRNLAMLADGANARRLLNSIAAISASEINFESFSRDLGLANNTLRSYADLLETLFLIVRVPPWSNNLLTRTIKSPKAFIADSGLLAFLVGADGERIATSPALGGSLFETFGAIELLRQSSFHDRPLRLHHYRDRDQREVDLIIERADGAIVAVEIKASASVTARDARGLKFLRDKLGDQFVAGALLYTGSDTLPVGDRIAAIPLSALWTMQD